MQYCIAFFYDVPVPAQKDCALPSYLHILIITQSYTFMQNYQLAGIERLIDDALRRPPETFEELQSLVLNDLTSEVSLISEYSLQVLYNANAEILQRYVQSHEHMLILLMDRVAVHLPPEQGWIVNQDETEFQWFDSYKMLYLGLEELLMFMQQRLGDYSNIRYRVPVSSLIVDQDGLIESVEDIVEGLTEAGIEKECIDILMVPLNELIACNSKGNIHYNRLLFLNQLKDGLIALVNKNSMNMSDKLLDLMIYLNFNDVDYYRYVTQLIEMEMDSIAVTWEKLVYLNERLTNINLSPVKSPFCYDPSQPVLRERLQMWLKEKMGHIDYYTKLSTQPDLPADLLKWLGFTLPFDWNIYEFSYFIGLCIDNKLIKNDNAKQVSNFYAQFSSTKFQEKLSGESIRNKMYKASPKTINAVRERLQELVNLTRE